MEPWLLAQGSETAEKGVGVLQTIIAGGVPLILAVMLAIALFVIYRLYVANKKLEADMREILTSQIEAATTTTAGLTEALTKNTTSNERVEAQLGKAHDTMTRINAELDRKEREARGAG